MALNIVEHIDGPVRVNRVLVSVSDKTGLDAFIPRLVDQNPNIMFYSTGGTYTALREILGERAETQLFQVSAYTGQPEMQGGLVKTLDFRIYLGLLSETYNDAHVQDLQRANAVALDMVVVNLYPFKETVAAEGVTPEQARTNIDIGGPCMIRASAKNYLRVASVTDPDRYGEIADELEANAGLLSLATRLNLSKQAFAHTAAYDTAIADYLAVQTLDSVQACYRVEGT